MPFREFLIQIQDGGFQQEIHQNDNIFSHGKSYIQNRISLKMLSKVKGYKSLLADIIILCRQWYC